MEFMKNRLEWENNELKKKYIHRYHITNNCPNLRGKGTNGLYDPEIFLICFNLNLDHS